MSLFRSVDGTLREISAIYRNVDGALKEIQAEYRSIDGALKEIFTAKAPPGSVEYKNPGNFTFRVPKGVKTIYVTAVAGGASGGPTIVMGAIKSAAMGPGGSAGHYCHKTAVSVLPDTDYTITIGHGGTNPQVGIVQTDGKNTTFSTHVVVKGGSGVDQGSVKGGLGGHIPIGAGGQSKPGVAGQKSAGTIGGFAGGALNNANGAGGGGGGYVANTKLSKDGEGTTYKGLGGMGYGAGGGGSGKHENAVNYGGAGAHGYMKIEWN